MSSKTGTRHETVLNIKQYSARGSTRCKAARRGGCSAGGDGRCEAAQLVAFLVTSMDLTSACAHYELILDITRVRLSCSHIGSMCRIRGSGP
ncbi:hypothetical protein ACFX2J_030626 [Malus domestica]